MVTSIWGVKYKKDKSCHAKMEDKVNEAGRDECGLLSENLNLDGIVINVFELYYCSWTGSHSERGMVSFFSSSIFWVQCGCMGLVTFVYRHCLSCVSFIFGLIANVKHICEKYTTFHVCFNSPKNLVDILLNYRQRACRGFFCDTRHLAINELGTLYAAGYSW